MDLEWEEHRIFSWTVIDIRDHYTVSPRTHYTLRILQLKLFVKFKDSK